MPSERDPTEEAMVRVLAENGMNWTWCDRIAKRWGPGPRVWITGEDPDVENSSPTFQGFDPFTNIAHAFMLVDKMREKGLFMVLESPSSGISTWMCRWFRTGAASPVSIETAETTCRAISLAVFAALEGK